MITLELKTCDVSGHKVPATDNLHPESPSSLHFSDLYNSVSLKFLTGPDVLCWSCILHLHGFWFNTFSLLFSWSVVLLQSCLVHVACSLNDIHTSTSRALCVLSLNQITKIERQVGWWAQPEGPSQHTRVSTKAHKLLSLSGQGRLQRLAWQHTGGDEGPNQLAEVLGAFTPRVLAGEFKQCLWNEFCPIKSEIWAHKLFFFLLGLSVSLSRTWLMPTSKQCCWGSQFSQLCLSS